MIFILLYYNLIKKNQHKTKIKALYNLKLLEVPPPNLEQELIVFNYA